MVVDPVSGAVLGGKLQPVYVYEAPVRIWHWVMMIAMFILIPTGYLIGSPWSGPREDAALTYFFGNVRVDSLLRRNDLRGGLCRCASTGRSSAIIMRARSSSRRYGAAAGGRDCSARPFTTCS